MRADIVPGGTFPDYELTDHTKKRRRLSELQGGRESSCQVTGPSRPERAAANHALRRSRS